MLEVNGPEKRVSGSSYSGETILKIRGRADGTGLIAAEKQIEEELSLRSPEERSQMVEKSRKSEIKATQRHNAIRVNAQDEEEKIPLKGTLLPGWLVIRLRCHLHQPGVTNCSFLRIDVHFNISRRDGVEYLSVD